MKAAVIHFKQSGKYAVMHRPRRIPLTLKEVKDYKTDMLSEQDALIQVQDWTTDPFHGGMCYYAEHGVVKYEM